MRSVSLWSRRDPFADFDQAFSSIVEHAFGGNWPVVRSARFMPAADVERDGDDVIIRLELPGLDVERDVTVDIENGRLVVHGERRTERNEDTDGRRIREIRYGEFERSFGLPEHITAEAVTASYDAGVLTIRIAGMNAPAEVPGTQRVAIMTTTPVEPTTETA